MNNKKIIFFVLLINFILKIVFIKIAEAYPTMDAENYLKNAIAISKFNFPEIYWPVGYAAFLSFFVIFDNLFILKLGNVILSTISLYYMISIYQLYFKSFSNLFVLFLALFPEGIFFTACLWSETLYSSLLVISIYFQFMGRNKISGLFYGLQLFVRPVSLFLPLIIYIFLRKKINNRSFKGISKIYIIIILIHLFWTGIVYYKTKDIVFVSTNGSVNLLIGNNPKATGHYDELGLQMMSSEGISSNNYGKYVLKYWATNWNNVPLLFFKKFYFMIFGENESFKSSSSLSILNLSKLPKELSFIEYQNIKEKIPNKELFIKSYSKKDNLYKLASDLSDFEKSMMAHQILYTFLIGYPENSNLKILGNISHIYNLFFIISSFISLVIYGFKREPIIIIPLYFIVIYMVFFGSPRFIFPIIPFFIIYIVGFVFKQLRRLTPSTCKNPRSLSLG